LIDTFIERVGRTIKRVRIGKRDYYPSTDTDQDLATFIEQLTNPNKRMLADTKKLLAQVQRMDRQPKPEVFLRLLSRSIVASTERSMFAKRVKIRPFNEAKSPIHIQLKQLIAKRRKFNIIVADPPWEYDDSADAGERGAKHKYPVMNMHDIRNMPVEQIAADNSVLLLWGTWPLMEDVLTVVRAWGFKYKTCGFVWVKVNPKAETDFMGGGHYTRSNTEFVLVATRGKRIERKSRAVMQVIREAIREHSQKPDEFFTRLSALYDIRGYKTVELFGRQQRPNITVLGNDTNRF